MSDQIEFIRVKGGVKFMKHIKCVCVGGGGARYIQCEPLL
jgi:hypothetical protein